MPRVAKASAAHAEASYREALLLLLLLAFPPPPPPPLLLLPLRCVRVTTALAGTVRAGAATLPGEHATSSASSSCHDRQVAHG